MHAAVLFFIRYYIPLPLLILYICQIVHLIFSDHINAYVSLNVSSACERQYAILFFFNLKKNLPGDI